MRELRLTGDEAQVLHMTLATGSGKGYTIKDLRAMLPVLEALEAQGREVGVDYAFDSDIEVVLLMKESEYTKVKKAYEGSAGWTARGKRAAILSVEDKLNECPTIKEPAGDSDKV